MTIRKCIESLLPKGGNLIIMSDQRNDFTDNRNQDKFSITRVGLKLDEGFRDSAYNGSIINHYIPNMLVNEGSSDLVILTSYPLGAGYPLDILSFVAQILRPGGFFLCYVPTILTKWAMPNVDSHVDCIIAIASRFGLIIPSEGELAKTYDDHTPLIFQKKQVPPRWQLGHLSDPGFVGFSKLFRDSFQLEPNPPLWNWKYGEGRGRSVIATRGGRLIAHYGSTLRAVSVFGDVGTAIQICDVMVDPHERGVMTRQGAMYITTTTFLEIYLGLLQYDIAYGFPNRRHMQLGERLGLYAEVARMVEIRWRPTTPKPSPGSRLHALNADSLSYQGLINKVWSKMAKDLAGKIVIIRDWDYIKYRYFRHPTNSYSVFGVISRWTGKLEGVIVLRQENQMCELVDMVVPLAKLPKMIDQACRVASRWGCESLYCWCTDYHAPLLATHAGVISPLDISVPASLWPPGRETAHLKDKWWLMSGDTEFR